MTTRALLPFAVAVSLLAPATAASAAETLRLDVREASNDGAAGPVATAGALADGQAYVAQVTGTVSIWPRSQWEDRGFGCGASESAPLFPSDGATGPTGWDAETVWAVPPGVEFRGFTCVPTDIPFHTTRQTADGFQIDDGTGFGHREPFGGARSVPRADHTYTYDLAGHGAPAGFQFVDAPARDNYGVFRIVVMTAAECAAIDCKGLGNPAQGAGPEGDQFVPDTGVASSSVFGVPSARRCISRRRITVRIRRPRGVRLTRISVRVGNRLIRVVRGRSLSRARQINLRGLGPGRFRVTLRATTSRGQILVTRRTYRTCTSRT